MDLCDALRKALYRPGELEDLEDVFRRYSIRELALLFLGLDRIPRPGSDRHREYLTRRRQFERYRAGIGLGPRGGQQTRAPRDLEEFLDSLRERIEEHRPPRGQSMEVRIKGLVRVSKDRRRRTIRTELEGPCVDAIVDALEEDDCDAAEEAFEECFGESAGMGASPEWLDVDELVMT